MLPHEACIKVCRPFFRIKVICPVIHKIIVKIFSYLTRRELAIAALVCRDFCFFSEDDSLWAADKGRRLVFRKLSLSRFFTLTSKLSDYREVQGILVTSLPFVFVKVDFAAGEERFIKAAAVLPSTRIPSFKIAAISDDRSCIKAVDDECGKDDTILGTLLLNGGMSECLILKD